MSNKDDLIKALEKKALGNEITLISEEFTQNEKGDFVLSKRTKKTTINDIDTSALLKLIELHEKEEQSQIEELKGLNDTQLRELAIQYAIQLIDEEQHKRKKKSALASKKDSAT